MVHLSLPTSHAILAALLLVVCRAAEGRSLQHEEADTTRDVPRLVLKDHTREVDTILSPLAHDDGPGVRYGGHAAQQSGSGHAQQ